MYRDILVYTYAFPQSDFLNEIYDKQQQQYKTFLGEFDDLVWMALSNL